MTAPKPNCDECKYHKKACEDIINGVCKKCRNKGITCVPHIPARRGRPPGTKNSNSRSSVRNQKREREAESEDEDEGDVPSEEEDEELGIVEEVTTGAIEQLRGEELEEIGSGEEVTHEDDEQPRGEERPDETDKEEMGEDTRFSTIMGHHPRTIAVPGGLYEFDREPVGSGGKGAGGGRFIPHPSDPGAVQIAVIEAIEAVDKKHADSNTPRDKIRLELNGKLRGSAKRAAMRDADMRKAAMRKAATPALEHSDDGYDSDALDGDDSEAEIPPLMS
ncbi:hypothetical protein CLAFUR0_07564 [Fulvia fulva]|nr:hypothetical protein CLAFUR0_07564 [Fulvia fulva]